MDDQDLMMLMNKQTLTQSSMPITPSLSLSPASTSSSSSQAMAMHNNSRTISKPKPKIRIIHLFAPEIIKTDTANFRELVQRLTGKPANKTPRRGRKEAAATKEEESNDFQIWSNNKGFLGGFADLEGFSAQDFGDFSFLPHNTMHGFDQEPQLIS